MVWLASVIKTYPSGPRSDLGRLPGIFGAGDGDHTRIGRRQPVDRCGWRPNKKEHRHKPLLLIAVLCLDLIWLTWREAIRAGVQRAQLEF